MGGRREKGGGRREEGEGRREEGGGRKRNKIVAMDPMNTNHSS